MGQQKFGKVLILCGFFIFSFGLDEPSSLEDLAEFHPMEGPKYQEFDWELFKAINRYSKEPNLIVSPFSIKLLLSTLAEAGNNNSAEQITNKLFPQVEQGLKTHDYYKNVLQSLNKKSEKFALNLGNKIYLEQNFTSKPEFLDIVQAIYGSEMEQVDFANREETASIINKWSTNTTNGHIKDIIKPDDLQDAVSVLVNTIYFKGTWKNIFSENDTKTQEFQVSSEKSVNVSMMHQSSPFFFHHNANSLGLGTTLLRLPYKGGKYAMTIVLPKDVNSLNDIINSIDESKLKDLQKQMHDFGMEDGYPDDVEVFLPKFKFESISQLKETLKTVGITDIFDSSSPLPGLGDGDIRISKVFQKAGIAVDERGTEIHAATGSNIINKMPPPKFKVDHPFVFFIEDEHTGVLLFAGKVTDPTI